MVGLEFIMKLRPVTYNFELAKLSTLLKEDIEIDKFGNEVSIPLSIEMERAKSEKENIRYTGFVAQEVEESANELGFDFSGVEEPQNSQDMYRLRYAEFVVPLVKAMQEQQEMINELKREIIELKKQK